MKPITCMNIALAGLLGLGGLTSGSALAGGPMIGSAQSCDVSIVIPKSVDDYYMSEDCKNVYLVPKRGGDLQIWSPDYTVDDYTCGTLDALKQDIKYYEASKKQLIEQRKFRIPGSLGYRQLTEQIQLETEILREAKNDLKNELVDAEGRYKTGVFMNVHFEKSDSDIVVGDAILANRELVKRGINFKMVPVAESLISIVNSDIYKEAIQTPVVVLTALPLQLHENSDPRHLTYYFNGSASGQIYLSASKGCQMRKDLGNNLNLVDPNKLAAYMTANQTYTVPLQTRVGYEAKIFTEQAVDDFLNFVQRKSKFKVQEFKDHITSSTSKESFDVKITLGEMSPQMKERLEEMGFFADLIENVKADMMERFLALLENHKILSIEDPSLSAPEAGVVKEPRVGYRCHTKSSWGGLRKKRNCGEYIYHVDVERDGFAQEARDVKSKLKVELDHSLSIMDVLYRYHTSSMTDIPKAQ